MKDVDADKLLTSIKHAIEYHVCEKGETVELGRQHIMISGSPIKSHEISISFIINEAVTGI